MGMLSNLFKRMGMTSEKEVVRPSTIIAKGIVFKGDIQTASDLTVCGEITGSILYCNDSQTESVVVVVGSDGVVQGDVTCDTLIAYGRVNGSIKARRVQIKSTAVIDGQISCDALRVEEGAIMSSGAFRVAQAGGT